MGTTIPGLNRPLRPAKDDMKSTKVNQRKQLLHQVSQSDYFFFFNTPVFVQHNGLTKH